MTGKVKYVVKREHRVFIEERAQKRTSQKRKCGQPVFGQDIYLAHYDNYYWIRM